MILAARTMARLTAYAFGTDGRVLSPSRSVAFETLLILGWLFYGELFGYGNRCFCAESLHGFGVGCPHPFVVLVTYGIRSVAIAAHLAADIIQFPVPGMQSVK